MSDKSPLYPDEVLSGDPDGGRGRRTRSGVWLVLDSLRRRPVPRRILGTFSILLLIGGVLLFSYPFLTNLYADWKQSGLAEDLASADAREAWLSRTIKPGDALTRIRIPKLGVDSIVVEGTSLAALRAGSGHYENTALPCDPGNVGIAGHRTTWSKPFANINELAVGDRIILDTPIGRCVYELGRNPWTTTPYDISVVAASTNPLLTLTTCDPPGSSSERLIVRAEMIKSKLFQNSQS
ncbi:MAG: class E sortase [Actinomycetota bacterium]